jgi:WXXGXW repeat (2 copies)
MKRYLIILLGILLCAGAFTPSTVQAQRVFVEIGDRPYYTHGSYYWRYGHRWIWIPGHWAWRHHHKFWIHGHYARDYHHRYY